MRACHLLAAVEWELSQLEGRQEQRAEPQAQHWLAGISGDAGTAEDRGVQAADQEPVCLHPDGEPQHFPGRRLHLWFFSARCEHVALSVSLSLLDHPRKSTACLMRWLVRTRRCGFYFLARHVLRQDQHQRPRVVSKASA
jgi:hypothetical protein